MTKATLHLPALDGPPRRFTFTLDSEAQEAGAALSISMHGEDGRADVILLDRHTVYVLKRWLAVAVEATIP